MSITINVWINEERYAKLQKAGLADMAEEVLAGLKVLKVPVSEEQKDKILQVFPTAKYDSATTKSIELLPREVKDKIFDLVVEKEKLDVMGDFLANY
ncbi:hypothetical protein GFC01_09840 [Desulfofundulus thermobenzoicus]|uniref:Uncharacterized protein n=1 Tax=Desulfofundulus thermobenzoicus TaxID=29376 RepID=A0A6N7IR48_9FIRM|nr:hypothetical protein [Desulfofundulus thermobenzoicus]MQL52556.1 hypothetical protein [Desulfofundulus thermobenzoicus]